MKNPILLSIIVLFISFSCQKRQIEYEAILTWTGEYAVDGCGFFIELNGETYKPSDESKFGDEYKTVYPIIVQIEYELPGNELYYYCGDLPESQIKKTINIISIKIR